MNIDVRREGNRAVLILTGPLVKGSYIEGLQAKVDDLLQQGFSEFVVKLEGASDVGNEVLAQLLQIHATINRRGGNLQVVGLPKRMSDLFTITVKLLERSDDASPELPDPFGARLERLSGSPAIWLTLSVALVILVIVIATLAGSGG